MIKEMLVALTRLWSRNTVQWGVLADGSTNYLVWCLSPSSPPGRDRAAPWHVVEADHRESILTSWLARAWQWALDWEHWTRVELLSLERLLLDLRCSWGWACVTGYQQTRQRRRQKQRKQNQTIVSSASSSARQHSDWTEEFLFKTPAPCREISKPGC